jgi:hypothetical protein
MWKTISPSRGSSRFAWPYAEVSVQFLGLFVKFRARRWRTLCVRQAYSKNTPAGSTWTSMIKSASSAVGLALSYRRQRKLLALGIEHHPVAPFCTMLENPWAMIERFFMDVLAALVIKPFELPADRTISIPPRGIILPLRARFCPSGTQPGPGSKGFSPVIP